MNAEAIIEFIRREEAVLWIGSGFSLYAGYPTGAELSQIIYDSLSATEKKQISKNTSLAELAEQHVRLRGNSRVDLNKVLRKVFTKKPSALHVHQTLAAIPHIKTIVTTNYDRLFEQAYGDRLFPIIIESDVALIGKKAELFKVHGDIEFPDTIIITKTDYSNFHYNRSQDNLLWSNIKARISNKAIVFIGYDLEDENLKNILRQVSDALGVKRKGMFLIAPGFKKHKVDYLAQLGIVYHNSKGEIFVKELSHSLKENIATDFDRGHVAPDTIRQFFGKYGLLLELEAIDNRFLLKTVKIMTDQLNSQITFKADNSELIQSFRDITSGKKIGEFTLVSESVEDLKFFLNDINILSSDTPFQLKFETRPAREGKVAVRFDDGLEFDDIHYKVYVAKEMLQVKAAYKGSNFICKVKYPFPDGSSTVHSNLSFEPAEKFKNVNEAISTYQLGLKIVQDKGMNIYPDGKFSAYRLTLNDREMPVAAIESNLEFFESLKTIESCYNIRFSNLGDYTKDDRYNAIKAVTFANGHSHSQEYTSELKFKVIKGMPLDQLEKIEGNSLRALAQVNETVVIYGHTINLGYKILQIDNLQLLNKDKVMRGETTTVRVRSKDNRLTISYSLKLDTEGQPGAIPANGDSDEG